VISIYSIFYKKYFKYGRIENKVEKLRKLNEKAKSSVTFKPKKKQFGKLI
jgi:hypothetical protein